jgi:hypothetical protein
MMPKIVGLDSNPLTALSDKELSEMIEFIENEIAKSKDADGLPESSLEP